jgi:type I restriction enzyme S subunit
MQSEYSNSFTYNFLSLNKDWIVSRYIQGGQGNLSGDIVKSIQIFFPKKDEQQKIASCLSSLDELITAHNDKLKALKDHKKGLMQNLFPQKGEKVPKFRFPEFEKDGEWEVKNLGDKEVSGFVNGKIDSEKLTLDNYISTDNMLPDYSGITKATKLPTTNRVTKFIKGDILISNIRPYLKKVWKSDRQGGASNDVLVFRSGSKVLSGFLEFILKNDAFINYVMQSAKGVKMPRGDKDAMLEYPTRLPDQTEQQKIATSLSALDELITAQAEKIAQLQQHKKGLMQGLFPKIND